MTHRGRTTQCVEQAPARATDLGTRRRAHRSDLFASLLLTMPRAGSPDWTVLSSYLLVFNILKVPIFQSHSGKDAICAQIPMGLTVVF
jgi:hypothetical protein